VIVRRTSRDGAYPERRQSLKADSARKRYPQDTDETGLVARRERLGALLNFHYRESAGMGAIAFGHRTDDHGRATARSVGRRARVHRARVLFEMMMQMEGGTEIVIPF